MPSPLPPVQQPAVGSAVDNSPLSIEKITPRVVNKPDLLHASLLFVFKLSSPLQVYLRASVADGRTMMSSEVMYLKVLFSTVDSNAKESLSVNAELFSDDVVQCIIPKSLVPGL